MSIQLLRDQEPWTTELLNMTVTALKNVVPLSPKVTPPKVLRSELEMTYGVLIGFTGDLKGNLVIRGDVNTFGNLGQVMFGMPLQDEMLQSFTGELGNMLAGSMATLVSLEGRATDITAPTVMQGSSILAGYEQSIMLSVHYEMVGKLDIFLMLKE
ncbi:chemotaxis protein CheX [Aciduricibacillus chroicocephali]|uniref:Chemotaxis protein CheX n=1 Tax=Aciduricibacillus chroicocephali TaxID=3054939 RepID=A0ABY9KW01_9BACI|nr:chemotaxis protein CheX [Bacillaceae bacterium 44XB]